MEKVSNFDNVVVHEDINPIDQAKSRLQEFAEEHPLAMDIIFTVGRGVLYGLVAGGVSCFVVNRFMQKDIEVEVTTDVDVDEVPFEEE